MVQTDTVEGTIDHSLWFHYDIPNDVLYVRLAQYRDVLTVAEESPEGIVLVRQRESEDLIGLTIVNWWKRFGQGVLPDSLRQLEHEIEPWARRVAA